MERLVWLEYGAWEGREPSGLHTECSLLFLLRWFWFLLVCLFETGSLYVVLAVLKLFVDNAILELADICLPLPPKYWE